MLVCQHAATHILFVCNIMLVNNKISNTAGCNRTILEIFMGEF